MEPSRATWSFVRGATTRGPRPPLNLDTLHALQFWRSGHPGRAFRLVRSSPFIPAHQLEARLSYQGEDRQADADLDRWCRQHQVWACVSAAVTSPPG